MDKAGPEIVLGHESAIGSAAKNQDVEPARVIADEQRVRGDGAAFAADAGADNPGCCFKESRRPVRASKEPFAREMERRADEEQRDEPSEP
jgi:hypothetical protein